MSTVKRILVLIVTLTFLCCVLVLSASAIGTEYTELISDQVSVDADTAQVTITFPMEKPWYGWHNLDTAQSLYWGYGTYASWDCEPGVRYTFRIYPQGYYPSTSDKAYWDNIMSLNGIPDETVFDFTVWCSTYLYGSAEYSELYKRLYVNYYDEYGYSISNQIIGETSVEDNAHGGYDYHFRFALDPPENAAGFRVLFYVSGIEVTVATPVQFHVRGFSAQFNLSKLDVNNAVNQAMVKKISAQLEAQGTTLNAVLDAQQETNTKLDDIITGGSAGDELIDKNDQMTDVGADLDDDVGAIEDFEEEYFARIEENFDALIEGGDLSYFSVPLSFVQRYLNLIVDGIPSKYLVVFTLPILLGVFMYIVGHPIRAPRPDTSGDTVTRETFTTTQVLAGRNAGRVTTTRTVTTSAEIGRVHNE